MNKKIILGIVATVMLSVGVFMSSIGETQLTTITFDINPSVKIQIDDTDTVVSFKSMNDDGEVLLEGVDLLGLDVDEATVIIFDRAVELGNIDMESKQNAILVTVIDDDDDSDDEDDIADDIEEKLNELAEEDDIDLDVIKQSEGITDELKEQADEFGISNGKMMFITKKAEEYGFEVTQELADMSIKDIQIMIKELTGNPSVENGKDKDEEKPDMSDPEVREEVKADKEAEKEARKSEETTEEDGDTEELEPSDGDGEDLEA